MDYKEAFEVFTDKLRIMRYILPFLLCLFCCSPIAPTVDYPVHTILQVDFCDTVEVESDTFSLPCENGRIVQVYYRRGDLRLLLPCDYLGQRMEMKYDYDFKRLVITYTKLDSLRYTMPAIFYVVIL